MAKVYGIDLGTTYSVITTLDDNGMPVVIENEADGTSFWRQQCISLKRVSLSLVRSRRS